MIIQDNQTPAKSVDTQFQDKYSVLKTNANKPGYKKISSKVPPVMLESSTFKMEGRGCPGGWVERTSLGKNGELFFVLGWG